MVAVYAYPHWGAFTCGHELTLAAFCFAFSAFSAFSAAADLRFVVAGVAFSGGEALAAVPWTQHSC